MKTYNITHATVDINTVKTPQVKQLVTILVKHRGTTHDHESMPKLLQDNELRTKQDPYLIFKYYQRELISLGVLRIDTISTAKTKVRGDKYWNYEGVDTIPAVVEVLEVVE